MNDADHMSVIAMEVSASVQRLLYADSGDEQVEALDALSRHRDWGAFHAGALLRIVADQHGSAIVEDAITSLLRMHASDEYRRRQPPREEVRP